MYSLVPALRVSALSLLFAGCANSPTGEPEPLPVPGPAAGSDEFVGQSLASYDQIALGITGRWEVREGTLRATGPANQSVLIRKDQSFEDGWVEARATRADDGGLVLRFTDESQYYLLAFRDDAAPPPRGEFNLAVYRRVGTEFTELARGDIHWPRGEPRTVRFEVLGGLLRVYVDGALIGDVSDAIGALPAGRPGLRQYGATDMWATWFDRFQWQEIPQ